LAIGLRRASEFDPSRWMPGGDAKEHMESDSFWPYGGGPRNCIGMGFAMMEVSLVSVTELFTFSTRLFIHAFSSLMCAILSSTVA
jgi:cytochrome P450